jgi:hypothetical protein
MQPFNIKIPVRNEDVTITILPTDQDYFKVVYYGGILGAIHYDKITNKWSLVNPAEVVAGDLPPYTGVLDEERVEIELDSEIIVKIGQEILKSYSF